MSSIDTTQKWKLNKNKNFTSILDKVKCIFNPTKEMLIILEKNKNPLHMKCDNIKQADIIFNMYNKQL